MMKRIIAFTLLICMFIGVVSCGDNTSDATTAATTAATTSTEATTDSTTPVSTEATTESTTATTAEVIDPQPQTANYDTEYLTVGDYVTVVYNTACADIKYEVKAGVGSKQTVTLTAVMNDGYTFDGWSQANAIVNGAAATSNELTCTFTAAGVMDIYLNASYTVRYDPNGGSIADGAAEYVVMTPATMYKTIHTAVDNGRITRDGYTLIEYNTAADGTGDGVSPGSRISMNDKGTLTLYCIWEKQSAESDFEVSGDTIKKYIGTATNVVIPEKIGGQTITSIAGKAFSGTSVERVVLTRQIATVESGAFANCTTLKSVVLFDSVSDISDRSFTGCSNLSGVQINGTLGTYSAWMESFSSIKMDRLIWAKDKKKIVLVGGSGTLMGYDSAQIDEAFNGDYVVINIGMNANLNISMYFEMLRDYMNEGDIILWSPEMGDYMFGSTRCGSRTWDFLTDHYDMLRSVDCSQYSGLLDYFGSFVKTLKGSLRAKETFSVRTGMTKYGDSLEGKEYQGHGLSYYPDAERYIGSGWYLSTVIDDLTANGVKVYYTSPAMDETCERLTAQSLKEYGDKVTEAFGIVEITPPELTLFPNEYFYNSEWHLLVFAAQKRTALILPYLVERVNSDFGTDYSNY